MPLIMVTHNPEQAARLADTVAVMAGGTIINQVGKDEFSPRGLMDILLESRVVA